MALTEPFDLTTPPGSETPTLGDDSIRQSKRAVKERAIRGGHYYPESATGTADQLAGLHACGVDIEVGTAPLADPHQFVIYEDDKVTPALTIDTDDGGARSVKLGDGIAGTYPYTLKADALAGKRDHTIIVPLYARATGRVKGTLFENRGGGILTLLGVRLSCFVAPVTTNLVVDIMRLASGYSDPNAAGTSIFVANPKPTVLATAFVDAGEITTFDPAVPTLAVGDAWVFNITTLSAAEDPVLMLRVRRTS